MFMKQLLTKRGLYVLLLSCIMPFASIAIDKIKSSETGNSFFLDNKGQITDQFYKQRKDIDLRFNATKGLNIFIGDGALHYQWYQPINQHTQQTNDINTVQEKVQYKMYRMDVELLGANVNAEIVKEEKQTYYENYYGIGGVDAAVALTYKKVTYVNVYPNIDWVLYTNNGNLKHEFVVRAGGNANDIKIKYSGITDLKINPDGSVSATTPMGEITEMKPYSYTTEGEEVASHFVLNNHVLSYAVADYQGKLIIDPNIEWGTYYAGLSDDYLRAIRSTSQGSTYSCGTTTSTSNIASSGAHDVTYSGNIDAIIIKFDKSGNRSWGTYYGSTGIDHLEGIGLNSSEDVYVVGFTTSTNGIATSGTFSGFRDGFLVKLNSNGQRAWGRYIGGSDADYCRGVAVAKNGDVYIAGQTKSDGLHTNGTPVYQKYRRGGDEAFLMRYSSSGTKLMCTYMGGNSFDSFEDVAIDTNGNIVVAGGTSSNAFIASNGSHQSTYGGSYDALVSSFRSDGYRNWTTYYGGSGGDFGRAIVIDKNNDIYVIGETQSNNNIATTGSFQNTLKGKADGFLVKFNSSGARQWGTYYGGSEDDLPLAITVSRLSGDIIVGGNTESTSDIATPGSYMTTLGGAKDAFMISFNTSGNRNWGTYYGGADDDDTRGLATDEEGYVYTVGITNSKSGIATTGAIIANYVSGEYGFLAKFCNNPNITTQPSNTTANKGTQATFSVAATGGGMKYQWQADVGTGFQDMTNAGQFSGVTTNTLTINNVTTANNNTVYRCKINSGSCEILSNTANLSVTTVGINNIELNSFEISPNPTTGIITINATDVIKKVEVFSVTGQKLLAETPNKSKLILNMTAFNTGMYIVKVNNTHVTRIIKQ